MPNRIRNDNEIERARNIIKSLGLLDVTNPKLQLWVFFLGYLD